MRGEGRLDNGIIGVVAEDGFLLVHAVAAIARCISINVVTLRAKHSSQPIIEPAEAGWLQSCQVGGRTGDS